MLKLTLLLLSKYKQQLINENDKINALDCKGSDIYPDDEDDNSQDNSACSEDEGNQSEPESLIYAIKGDTKNFRSAVSSSIIANTCLLWIKDTTAKSNIIL